MVDYNNLTVRGMGNKFWTRRIEYHCSLSVSLRIMLNIKLLYYYCLSNRFNAAAVGINQSFFMMLLKIERNSFPS